ncbi:MAG: ATP-dependent DNA helicase [Coriobacteriales bacterium]|jgi:DNA helicase-2/ATP-dependent DNA helicase PcrA
MNPSQPERHHRPARRPPARHGSGRGAAGAAPVTPASGEPPVGAPRPSAAQLRAITTLDRPLRIIAPPGSGKTYTLVMRTVHLLELGVDPASIMLVTFTREAAAQLRGRLARELARRGDVDIDVGPMCVGTIHSACLRLIKDAADGPAINNFRVADAFDQRYLTFLNWDRFAALPDWGSFPFSRSELRHPWRQFGRVASLAGFVTEELVDCERMQRDGDPRLRAVAQATGEYRAMLRRERCMDFSSILLEAYNLLRRDEFAERVRQRVRYVMVDEYQDTNAIQEQILLGICGPSGNICVAGDEDQALYRFRGATVRNIEEFPNVPSFHGRCLTVTLADDYRSDPSIRRFASAWMHPDGPDAGQGEPVPGGEGAPADAGRRAPGVARLVYNRASDAFASWEDQVCAFVGSLRAHGVVGDYGQVAFVTTALRGNAHVTRLARRLERAGVHVFAPRADAFFDRPEVRLALGVLLRVLPQFSERLDRIKADNANRRAYLAYLSRDCMGFTVRWLSVHPDDELARWVGALRAGNLAAIAPAAGDPDARGGEGDPLGYSFSDLLMRMVAFEPFRSALDRPLTFPEHALRASRNLALLADALANFEYFYRVGELRGGRLFEDARNLFDRYLYFRWTLGVRESELDGDVPPGSMPFMTIHQAKGTEFPVVLVDTTGASPWDGYEVERAIRDGYGRYAETEPAEEVARLDFDRKFYTAFTRARGLLVLTGARGVDESFKRAYEGLPDVEGIDLSAVAARMRRAAGDDGAMAAPEARADGARLAAVGPAGLPAAAESHAPFPSVTPVASPSAALPAARRPRGASPMPTFSFTGDVAVYERCPRSYKLFRVLGFPRTSSDEMVLGTLVHQTIEDVHRAVLSGRRADVSGRRVGQWLDANYRSLREMGHAYLDDARLAQAKRQVMRYVAWRGGDWDDVREAEFEVSEATPLYVIRGRVDLMTGRDGAVDLFDFKTGAVPEPGSPLLAAYRDQLQLYAHLVERRRGCRVGMMHLFFPGDDSADPTVSFPRTQESIDATMERFDRVARAIMARDFEHLAGDSRACASCAFRHYCGRAADPALSGPGAASPATPGPRPR